MNILSIDPGPEYSAYVIWDGKRILGKGIFKNEEGELLKSLMAFDYLVIEQIKSYGMAVSDSIFDTVFWTGRFIEKWLHGVWKDKPWARVPRREVKMHLCGTMRAKDSNIRAALIDRFGSPGTKKNPGVTYGIAKDIWQAFALGVYWYDTQGGEKL